MRVELDSATRRDRDRRSSTPAFTRVGFSDTDVQGIVYYGRYLPTTSRARHHHLGLLGLDTGGEPS